MVHQVHKDFAPGIEAARQRSIPSSRPLDDLFHFMGKENEMQSRMQQTGRTSKGTYFKEHYDWMRSSLYSLADTPTADMVDQVWPAFLCRLLCKGEPAVTQYFFENYCRELTVGALHNMRVVTNNTDVDMLFFFLSWWGGFGVFPGTFCGSSNSEAFNSHWQAAVDEMGAAHSVDEALDLMQQIYSQKWSKQYSWDVSADHKLSIWPEGIDPNLLNGAVMDSMGRSTAFDAWCGKYDFKKHVFQLRDRSVTVLSRDMRRP
eukprot:9604540-Karenia_brevis.AAC.1